MDELTRRVERLERENRLLKGFALLAFVAILGSAPLMGQVSKSTASDVVRTRGLELVDDQGRERATLSAQGGDFVGLVLWDAAGKARVSMEANKDGSSLFLSDSNAKHRVSLWSPANGGDAEVALNDENAKERLRLWANANASGQNVTDETTKIGAFLKADKRGAWFQVLNGAQKSEARIETLDGSATLALSDAAGYASTFGVTSLVDTKTGTKSPRSAASIVMIDKDGRVVWEAPQ
jgi:hypothetical protein